MKFSSLNKFISIVALTCFVLIAGAGDALAADAPRKSELSNITAAMLTTIAVVLLLVIGMLANVLIGAAALYLERLKNKENPATKILMIAFFCMLAGTASAQDNAMPTAGESISSTIAGMSKSSFYLLSGVIALEVVVIFAMLLFLYGLIATNKKVVVQQAIRRPQLIVSWWNKLNALRPTTEEAAITLNHDYDGIRELDNKLPPWWVYGFYACILFGVVYLYRFHVSHVAPSPLQEYESAMVQAHLEKEAYLKTAASKVDENTVQLISDATALAEGKKIFINTCAACHGSEGQGVVGPNLTDDYWLHNGSVKDIFTTIKYGFPEKGMKSWKEDFSPLQIAAIASYIKTLRGTRPANAREPQGDLYREAAPATTDTVGTHEKRLAKN